MFLKREKKRKNWYNISIIFFLYYIISIGFNIFLKYIVLLLLRRVVFIVILVYLGSISLYFRFGGLLVLQFIYLSFVVYIRPYWDKKLTWIEIINELYFLLCIGLLCYYNTESKWSSTFTRIYIWILLSNSICTLFFVLGKANSNFSSRLLDKINCKMQE